MLRRFAHLHLTPLLDFRIRQNVKCCPWTDRELCIYDGLALEPFPGLPQRHGPAGPFLPLVVPPTTIFRD